MGLVGRLLKPLIVGVRHVFTKPITVKYPFTKLENIQEEHYSYDPKIGVAVPGYRGRHLLYLDRCTGCGACERACQEISEAMSLVYAFDVELEFDEGFKRELEGGGDAAVLVAKLSKPFGVFQASVEKRGETYALRLNDDPLWECRSETVYENFLLDPLEELKGRGWSVERLEKPKGVEALEYLLRRGETEVKLSVRQRNLGYRQNRRSIFPAIDYGRCVFCGFCVDACPFRALEMTGDYELSSLTREELFYNPLMLASPPLTTHPPESTWAEKLVLVLRRYR